MKCLLKSVWLFVHNVLMVGSPGAGKTLLARAMPGILPEMSIEESLDVTRIYSVADQLPAGTPLIRHRRFRAPHHTISHAGLVDGDSLKPCTCAHAMVTKYQKRISGPLLDRIDIHIEVPRVDYEKLSGDRIGESSEAIRGRVQTARNIQNKRFSPNGSSDIICNADMRVGGDSAILQVAGRSSKFDAGGDIVLCMTQMNLSARAYHRTRSVKLARTIADLAGCEEIQSVHLAEALQ